jgi:hypothetical protein
MNELGEHHGFGWWALWCLRETRFLVGGLVMATLGGQGLIDERFPNLTGFWRAPVIAASVLALLWMLWALSHDLGSESDAQKSGSESVLLLGVLCVGVLAWQREHAWAVVGLGLGVALLFVRLAKSRGRSYVIAITGWVLAGFVVLLLQWPNAQRFLLVLVAGGLLTALQGAFELAMRPRSKDTRCG